MSCIVVLCVNVGMCFVVAALSLLFYFRLVLLLDIVLVSIRYYYSLPCLSTLPHPHPYPRLWSYTHRILGPVPVSIPRCRYCCLPPFTADQ